MIEVTFDRLTSDVAAILGESLSLECQPDESPFPGIKERVRILAPGILARLLIVPRDDIDLEAGVYVSETLYYKLIMTIQKVIKPE